MKPTRLRFKKNQDGLLQSNVRYETLHDLLVVYIDQTKVRYYIKNQDGVLKASGAGRTKGEILPQIKKDLKELGVKFVDEVRMRKKRDNGGIYERAGDNLSDNVLVNDLRSGS